MIADVVRALEQHVSQRGGLKGMALKTGLALVKGAKPDILERAVGKFLPDLVTVLEPAFTEFRKSSNGDFSVHLGQQAQTLAQQLLSVADAKIASSQNATAKSAYQKFRGGAADEVQQLLPRLGKVVSAYL